MKKLFSEITVLAGVILVFLGLVVCMCETTDFSKQLATMLCGVGIMVAGSVICYLGNERSKSHG